jgi:sugar phosphate isomerase/epimerase
MEVGIFAKTFCRPTLEATLDAVAAHGIRSVQFNMACAGLPSLPDAIEPELCDRVRKAAADRDIEISAVSGTFNLIHPCVEDRLDGLSRLRTLAFAARRMGTGIVTLSTGTRHPTDMWAAHPDNGTREAWADLVRSMEEAVRIAGEADIKLAFEPEVSNVVDTAEKARRLLDEVGSIRLKVLMDGANLFRKGDLSRMAAVLESAFELVGRDIALAHAKDLSRDGEAGHEAAGTGLLDYDLYIELLRASGYDGPLVLHGLSEEQVTESVAFLRRKLAPAGTRGGL